MAYFDAPIFISLALYVRQTDKWKQHKSVKRFSENFSKGNAQIINTPFLDFF